MDTKNAYVMKRLSCLCMLLVCNGCATATLHRVASRTTGYHGGANEPYSCITAEGDLEVFEDGCYGVGRSAVDPPYTSHRIHVPLSRILRSVTNGQATVRVRVNPRRECIPTDAALGESGGRRIPVRRVDVEPSAGLPEDAVHTSWRRQLEGTNAHLVARHEWLGTENQDPALLAYLERHGSDTSAPLELLYLDWKRGDRRRWIWHDRNGLPNGGRFVAISWDYPPERTRRYLYALVPLTVAADIATFPVQVGMFWYALHHADFNLW